MRGSHFHAQNISIQINCTENDWENCFPNVSI